VSRGDAVVGYARGSPDAGKDGSLETQRAAIEAESERSGWRLLRVEEDMQGGGKGDRPRLSRVLAAVSAGEARTLVVARLDRALTDHTAMVSDGLRARAGTLHA
jgi:DNA invertase Pin-like site-specific DNA recombinase